MYGEEIEIELGLIGEETKIKSFILCSPKTRQEEKEKRLLKQTIKLAQERLKEISIIENNIAFTIGR
jgi:hypothetical protein